MFRKPEPRTAFDGLDDWLRERFFRHGGNAGVIRQEVAAEHGIVIGLRSLELRVRGWRRELAAQKRATVRFETGPGVSCRSTSAKRRYGPARSGFGRGVLGDAGLFPPRACPGLAPRVSSRLVRRHGGDVPGVWWRSRGRAARQCEGAGRAPCPRTRPRSV